METLTSHTERYIIVPNEVIRSIGALSGVDVFRLYIELLLQKNWCNEVYTTPKLLLRQLGRDTQYWRKQLKCQVQTLIEKNIITTESNVKDLSLNDHLHLRILLLRGSATTIKCVNSEIFNLHSPVSVNALFAVFVFVSMCVNRDTGIARISIKTIADGLGVSEKTVEKGVKILEDSGYFRIKRGVYIPSNSKNECNQYRVNDYGSLMYRAKHGLVSLSEKQALSECEEADAKIELKISEVLANPSKFSPCVFKGIAAKFFRELCCAIEFDSMLTICALSDMESVIDDYSGILSVHGGVIVLDFKKLTDGIEDCIVAFINDSVVPIVLLLEDGLEITSNRLKSQAKHIFY